MRPLYKPAITQYNSTDYDVLRRYLFPLIGAYCPYCEQPISNDSAVEHKAPKAAKTGFPAYDSQWRNLLLACQTCNSAKWARPDKREVPTGQRGTKENWFRETLKLWVFPDKTDAMPNQDAIPGAPTLQLFSYVHDARSQQELVNANLLTRYWTFAPAWSTTQYTMTWVVPNATFIATQTNPPLLTQRVERTIRELSLNRYNPEDQKYNDRRVINREAAYQAATTSLQRLAQVMNVAWGSTTGAQEINLIIAMIRQTVVAMGFWSTWFQVFWAALNNPPNTSPFAQLDRGERLHILRRIFLYYFAWEQNGNDSVLIFPGTDPDRVPLDSLV